MDQAVPVESHASKRYPRWSGIALTVVIVLILIISSGHLLIWAVPAMLVQPLTVVAATAMFLLPGLALVRLLWADALQPAERWPLAIGISCVLPPLLLLLSEPLGLRWNMWLGWGYLLVSGVVWRWPRQYSQPAQWRISLRPPDREHLLLLAITAMTIITRLYVVRDMPAGMWGDSVHHTIIAQLLVDNGGLFSSWQPYAPLTTFTYHYGFHSNVAWLSWLSDTPTTQSLLIVGQLQSALAAPLVYLLTRRLLGNGAMALWAALIVGLLASMPAYYVNWGRYTQLAGQTVLLAASVVWMALLDRAIKRPVAWVPLLRLLILTTLVTAGLALTHYRVGLFAACFVAAYTLYLLLFRVRSFAACTALCGTGLIAGIVTLAAVFPWLLRLREGRLLLIGQSFASQNVGLSEFNVLPSLNDLFLLHTRPYMLPLAVIGLGLLLWRRQWYGLVLVFWAGLVWLVTNPYLVGLPGAGIISNFAVVIANYLVLAPLAGAAIALIFATLAHRLPQAVPIERWQVLLGVILMIWSSRFQQQIIEPKYQLLTPADAAAMEWIQRETPPDSRFFVNSFPAYSNTLYAGSDGGWWLSFMSGRQTNIPPLLYGNEAGEQPDYVQTVYDLNAALQHNPPDTPETATALRAAGYHYIYDGPAANPDNEYIDPTVLAQSPLYELVYSDAGVTIWKVP